MQRNGIAIQTPDTMARRSVPLALALVAFCAALIALIYWRGGEEVSAEQLLERAASAGLDVPPSSILHLQTSIYLRTKPQELRLQDPYHRDPYEAFPENVVADAWFETGGAGELTRRYTVVTAEDGKVIQEELRDSPAEEQLYVVAEGVIEKMPVDENAPVRPLDVIDIAALPSGAEVKDAGAGEIAGIRTRVVKVISAPVQFSSAESAYERPYVRDLDPESVVNTFEIDPTSNAVLARTIDLVDEAGVTRVSRREVRVLETMPSSSALDDLFEFKHAAGVPTLEEANDVAEPETFVARSLSDSRLRGLGAVVVPAAEDHGLSFVRVHGALDSVTPPIDLRDIRLADIFGLAVATEYKGPAAVPGEHASLRILSGQKERLLPILRSQLPFWSHSELVEMKVFGKRIPVWHLDGDDVSAAIAEYDGKIIFWEGQGLSQEALLSLISDSSLL